jgi:hypothetical protein
MKERYYGREISICVYEVACLDLPGLGVLERVLAVGTKTRLSNSGAALTDLVVARPYESIVAQIPTDVSGDDFSVDTISRNKILVRTGRGSSCGAPIAFCLSRRHDGMCGGSCDGEKNERKEECPERGRRDVKVKHTTAA